MEDNTSPWSPKIDISIVLPVHNQEKIIGKVIRGIVENASDSVIEMFVILGDCTDNSEDVMLKNLVGKRDSLKVKIVYSKYSDKLILCNIGCESSEHEYSLIVPDNMIIDEPDFDQRLFRSFEGNVDGARNGTTLVLLENSKLTELNFDDIVDE